MESRRSMNTGPSQPPWNNSQGGPYQYPQQNSPQPGPYQPPPYNNPRPLPYHANQPTPYPGQFQQPPYDSYQQPPQKKKRKWVLGCVFVTGALLLCVCSALGASAITRQPTSNTAVQGSTATVAGPTITVQSTHVVTAISTQNHLNILMRLLILPKAKATYQRSSSGFILYLA